MDFKNGGRQIANAMHAQGDSLHQRGFFALFACVLCPLTKILLSEVHIFVKFTCEMFGKTNQCEIFAPPKFPTYSFMAITTTVTM